MSKLIPIIKPFFIRWDDEYFFTNHPTMSFRRWNRPKHGDLVEIFQKDDRSLSDYYYFKLTKNNNVDFLAADHRDNPLLCASEWDWPTILEPLKPSLSETLILMSKEEND